MSLILSAKLDTEMYPLYVIAKCAPDHDFVSLALDYKPRCSGSGSGCLDSEAEIGNTAGEVKMSFTVSC